MNQNNPCEKKCRDCEHCKESGWWDRSKYCDVSGSPVNEKDVICISFYPKNK